MNRTEFLQRRKSGIGGSDVAAVLGVSAWKTPYELWQDKTSPEVVEMPETEVQHFGNVLEVIVAGEFARRHGVKIARRNQLFRHKEHPELIADIDRYIVGGSILECKTCGAWAAGKFGAEADEIPDQYFLQVQHYMLVTGYHDCWLAVLIGGNEYRDFHIEYNPEIALFAAQKCLAFWDEFVLTGTPPPPSYGDNLAEYYKARSGATLTANEEVFNIACEIKELKRSIKANEELLEKWEFNLKTAMGENEILLTPDGEKFCTWKQGKERQITDWKAVATEAGASEELIAKYTETKPGNRPLLFTKMKEKEN